MVPDEVLAEATKRLVEGFHPDRIILFGSQARGDADERSDVDLLVVAPIERNRHDLACAMDRSMGRLPIACDIVLISPEEFERERRIPGYIARYAAQEGRVLYDRS